VEEESSCRRRRVDAFGEALKADAGGFEVRDELHELAHVAAQSIKLPNDEDVALARERESVSQAAPIAASAARLVGENPLAAGARECVLLQV
jgi:hypothetical protein